MHSLIQFSVAALFLSACSGGEKKQEQTQTDEVVTPTVVAAVQLSDAQKADGWELLFDGVTMNGWRVFKNKDNASWEVKDGTLHCVAFDDRKTPERSDILTSDDYENFELSVDWKIAPKGNTGIIYRATEEFDEPFLSGPEYQLVDDAGYPGTLADVNKTACNYDMQIAENKKVNPIGEWDTSKIVVNGNHVEHWLNGDRVLQYELGSADWKKRKAGSKWKDAVGYGAAKKGHIDLQDHGDEAWFRNIMIRKL